MTARIAAQQYTSHGAIILTKHIPFDMSINSLRLSVLNRIRHKEMHNQATWISNKKTNHNIGEQLSKTFIFNEFEPLRLNLISTAELLVVLVAFAESSLSGLLTRKTSDYLYFGDSLRIP